MTICDNPNIIIKAITAKKMLVFDFDGVIADSNEVKADAFASLYIKHGQDIVDKVVAYHRDHGGVSRFEKLKYFHGEFLGLELDEQALDLLAQKFSRLVVDKVIAAEEISGFGTFIERFSTDSRDCVVNSATPQGEIQTIVSKRNLDRYFSMVYGSPSSKTNNLEKAMSDYGVTPEDVIFFGDSSSDLQAANNKKVDFVGVGDTVTVLMKQLPQASKQYSVASFQGLID